MNYLQLAQRLRQESGVPGTGPASVKDQTKFDLQLVNWIATAYEDVQNMHPRWRFLQEDFSFVMTIGKRNYTAVEAGITDLETWKDDYYGGFRRYLQTNASDEQAIQPLDWETYRLNYLFGTNRTASGQPSIFSVKPNNSIDFYQVPNQEYNIDGEYFKQPDIMVENTDTPVFPSQFHMIIVWRALMFYGAYDAADERYTHGQNEYKKILRKLEVDQLVKMTYGNPLV